MFLNGFCYVFKLFLRSSLFFQISGNQHEKPCLSGYTEFSNKKYIQEKFYMRRPALRVPGGNLVDGLPPARHTEAVAKPGRLGPAQNDEPMQNLFELTMFCSMIDKKTHRISCPEYTEDLDKYFKM